MIYVWLTGLAAFCWGLGWLAGYGAGRNSNREAVNGPAGT